VVVITESLIYTDSNITATNLYINVTEQNNFVAKEKVNLTIRLVVVHLCPAVPTHAKTAACSTMSMSASLFTAMSKDFK